MAPIRMVMCMLSPCRYSCDCTPPGLVVGTFALVRACQRVSSLVHGDHVRVMRGGGGGGGGGEKRKGGEKRAYLRSKCKLFASHTVRTMRKSQFPSTESKANLSINDLRCEARRVVDKIEGVKGLKPYQCNKIHLFFNYLFITFSFFLPFFLYIVKPNQTPNRKPPDQHVPIHCRWTRKIRRPVY